MRTFNFAKIVLATLVLFSVKAADAQDKATNRYPFDPACPWGRLANGKGIVIRCLTETEVAQLSAPKASVPANTAATAGPSAPSSVSAVASADVTKKTNGSDAKTEVLDADVVSVTAEEGKLDSAKKKLRAPRDKYARCVGDNGGLSAEAGEVTVRFLVRERGRAEGTEVEKRLGVSEGAAKCIAGIVDRRPVGTPEGPVVAATAVIRITRQLKR
jgi:hypothetical protein